MTKHERALILNADYTPIGLVSWEKAITLDFKGLVKVVDFYKGDEITCSSGFRWPVPAVIVLTEYKRPKKKRIPFSRKNIFIRDGLVCQYCNKRFDPSDLTFDHVVPRSKWNGSGTPTQWKNIVTCCYPCNNKKGSKHLKDTDMQLMNTPREPNPHGFVLGLAPWSKLQPEWLPYIPNNYKEIMQTTDLEGNRV